MNIPEENKRIIRDFFHEFRNEQHLDAWDTYCSEKFTHHFNIPDISPDLRGIKTLSQGILSAFPDISTNIDRLIADGDYVVVRSTLKATHSGIYQKIEPTYKTYKWQETIIYRLKDEKIIECFPEVRLEKLLWQISGKDQGFTAPRKSILSSFIAVIMSGLAKLYKNRDEPQLSIVENNKSIVHRYVNEFKNQQKFAVFPKLFSDRFIHHFDFPGRSNRMDSFVSVGQTFLRAFPDVSVDLQRLLAENDIVVDQNKVSATHQGAFNGIQATGKKVHWTEIHIYRLENGKIIENWPAVNFERILLQIR